MVKSRTKTSITLVLLVMLAASSCKKSPQNPPTTPGGQATADNDTETTTQAPDKDMIELPTKMPNATFTGTPTNLRGVTNLEEAKGIRPPFYVPKGTTNVAFGKSVTSTDEEPIFGDLEMITDGDKDAIEGSCVELGPGIQYITIDLEGQYEIYAVLFWHDHRQKRAYRDVIVQIADDIDFTENVRTLFNNDMDNSAGLGIGKDKHYVDTSEGKLVKVDGQQARFVRLYSNGNNANDMNHYIEVEVFGK